MLCCVCVYIIVCCTDPHDKVYGNSVGLYTNNGRGEHANENKSGMRRRRRGEEEGVGKMQTNRGRG